MQTTVGTPTEAHSGTIYVAIEVSQRSWVVTMHSPVRDRFSRHQVGSGDEVGLLRLIEGAVERAERQLGARPGVVSCYESGYDGFWLHRRLMSSGVKNLVFDPASIAVEQRGRRAKTDRIDGELLLRTLMAHCRGEPRVVRLARVPSEAEEDARRASRERERLIKERTMHSNRIKGLLRLEGLAAGNPLRPDWRDWLQSQQRRGGGPLPPHLRAELEREHGRLMLVCEQLAGLAPVLDGAAADRTPAHMVERKDLLQRLKGIGPVIAALLVNEVFYKNFDNRRQVAGYFGLAPSPWCSGGTEHEQGISKAGNARARRMAIELAWLWVRHQSDSALSRWFRARTAGASKRIRRIAIVALARKLMVALWRYLTTGLIPEQAVIKA